MLPRKISLSAFTPLSAEEMWKKYLPHLHKEAEQARSRARQYRGIHVGAAALVMSVENGKEMFGVLTGANRKFREGDCPDRLCAEMDVMDRAFRLEWQWIVGFVVCGPHQPDDSCGIDLGTLAMCGHCRNDVRSLQGVYDLVTPQTKFVSRNPDSGTEAHLTVGDLLEHCGGQNGDPAIYMFPPRATRAWNPVS